MPRAEPTVFERRAPADTVHDHADDGHEEIHAKHVCADDRKDEVLCVMVMLHDDITGEIHD